MNLKRSPFSILDKDKREMDYIKGVYKRKIQAEIESYKDPEEEDNSEIEERSEEELLEEEIRNQQTLDSFVESDKNWSWPKLIY